MQRIVAEMQLLFLLGTLYFEERQISLNALHVNFSSP